MNTFFGAGAGEQDKNVNDSIKNTLILIVGYICKHCKLEVLQKNIEGRIIQFILPFMPQKAK